MSDLKDVRARIFLSKKKDEFSLITEITYLIIKNDYLTNNILLIHNVINSNRKYEILIDYKKRRPM